MNKVIRVDPFDRKSIDAAINQIKAYKAWVAVKEKELREKLAARGVSVAEVKFRGAVYDGRNDISVRWEDDGAKATIYASGQAVAFIEFGSGAKYGYGHPQASEFGLGPGTWSDGPNGKGHWDDPDGWWYNHKRTFGNPPAMAMYEAVQQMTQTLAEIATEVFST